MASTQSLSLRTSAQSVVRTLRGVAHCIAYLLSIPTTCPHTNTHKTTRYQQACWDCGRIRTIDSYGLISVWHREVR